MILEKMNDTAITQIFKNLIENPLLNTLFEKDD